MPKNSYFKEVDNKDVFVMSDFDKNYKFKGFQEEQFKKISNKYTEFIGKQVSEDQNNAVILISEEHVFATRYGYGVIVDSSHVVWVKSWQVWGINRTNTAYAINFSREFYNVKEYGDFSENFSDDLENSMLGDFDKVVKIANEQAELRSTVEGQERASKMGFGFNF